MSRDPFRDIHILYCGTQGGVKWRLVAGTNTKERMKPKRIEVMTDQYGSRDYWVPLHEAPRFTNE